jgi:GNAT superfamily N-acetyltransferase
VTAVVSTPARVQVRPARQDDVGAVALVYLRSRHAAVPAIPPLVHDDEEVRRWSGDTVFSEQELFVAEDGAGRVVGLLVLAGDVVEQLYVDPGHTRAGVGSQLLAVAKSLRPGGLQLWTFQSNHRARRFYEKHGFTPVEWTDGAHNEEQVADVRYAWGPD